MADEVSGVEMIAAERRRQVDAEAWTPKHDDRYEAGELISAARAYCWPAYCNAAIRPVKAADFEYVPNDWPVAWDKSWWKPSDDPVRNLVKAGALIAAEIDRLQRKAEREFPEVRA